ncbi:MULTISPECIES: glycosyltransferase [unclassified Isoptericola]|uniref:glycosyltransferase n=1 Tax=unclassified Isoptericola TaxID=2623355 RepID=UPI0027123646|nr:MULTISPECIES: glycosyltransferase [unclassified Isoptericola]MDO8144254.1 glycosyltransferase [Isoptericola sp. 178]MDO8148108.1 glycosyltransferase [Isoptericola sp. b515]
MRVLFASTGNLGHFLPQVPLAHAAGAAGHEVRVAAPAGFADQVAREGLVVAPFDEPSSDAMGRAFGGMAGLSMEAANELMIREIFGRLDGGAALPRLLDTVRSWRPDLVVRDPFELASLVAAEAEGIPHRSVGLCLDGLIASTAPWFTDPAEELGRPLGLDADGLISAQRSAPSFTVLPASFDDPPSGGRDVVRFRPGPTTDAPEGRGLPPETSDLPLVYASLGTVAGTMPSAEQTYRELLAALASLDVRVLLTVGRALDPDRLRPWPDNAHVEQWWPQEEVLPHAVAVVGHGGFGTTAAALAAGVPQVAVPLFALDQWFNARRLDERGLGRMVTPGEDFPDRLGTAVAAVLDDADVHATSERVAGEMAAHPPTTSVVDRLVAPAD